MRYAAAIMAVGAALTIAGPALAEWDPGDGHKMHYPQLPDPQGWGVMVGDPWILADDWTCGKSGSVSEIHFWFSVQGDGAYDWFNINVWIHENIPDPDGPGPGFSKPGDCLWSGHFESENDEFTVRSYGSGEQGFYDPVFGDVYASDHFGILQANIVDIPDPFVQTEGQTYWLALSLWGEDEGHNLVPFAWKTSLYGFEDAAVYDAFGGGWSPLFDPGDPFPTEQLDLAFVIAPEPVTLSLLALGGLALLRRKRGRRA